MPVKPIPDGFHTLTPYLICKNSNDAIAWYTKALGARELYRMPGPGGSVMHAELQIGSSRLMLADENPQRGTKSPATLGGTPVSTFIYTEDVDAAFNRAVSAGAQATMPPTDMFWGDRFASFVDPAGHEWQMATHKEDVSPDEMMKRLQAGT
jgi:PhnB protein